MSDAALRDLERRWRASRDVDDEARWLQARVRAGELPERGIVIAAGLGHAAALKIAPAIGLGPIELVETPEDPAVGPPGPARPRAAIAFARMMERQFDHRARGQRAMPPGHFAPHLAKVEAWLLCPCADHTLAVATPPAPGAKDCVPECCWDPADYPAAAVALALNELHECARVQVRIDAWFDRLTALLSWRGTFDHLSPVLPVLANDMPALRVAGEAAIRAEVVPWALGYGDPVRARAGR